MKRILGFLIACVLVTATLAVPFGFSAAEDEEDTFEALQAIRISDTQIAVVFNKPVHEDVVEDLRYNGNLIVYISVCYCSRTDDGGYRYTSFSDIDKEACDELKSEWKNETLVKFVLISLQYQEFYFEADYYKADDGTICKNVLVFGFHQEELENVLDPENPFHDFLGSQYDPVWVCRENRYLYDKEGEHLWHDIMLPIITNYDWTPDGSEAPDESEEPDESEKPGTPELTGTSDTGEVDAPSTVAYTMLLVGVLVAAVLAAVGLILYRKRTA